MTDEQGFHQLCCVATGEGNQLRDAQGERLHVSQHLTDEQVLNSPMMKAARVELAGGQWPAACERCRQAEAAGGVSIRQHLNERFERGRKPDLLRRTAPDGTLDGAVVRYADIRLGNACNLTCRMCGPVASRLWAPHYNQVQPRGYRLAERELRVLGQNNWVKQESLEWLLRENLPTVEALHFAGGEPLIVPEMGELLDLCIASGRAGEISLSYNTNLTTLPERVTSRWSHFKQVSLLCSIDGYEKMNDYIRRPSRWSDIDRNLKLLDAKFDEWKIAWATVSVTVQIYNVLTLDELFAYLRESGFQRVGRVPQLVPLFDPRYLSIQVLPARVKSLAKERLQRELARVEDAALAGAIRSTIAFLEEGDQTRELPNFFAFTEASDREFGDSWQQVAPELAALLKYEPRDWFERVLG